MTCFLDLIAYIATKTVSIQSRCSSRRNARPKPKPSRMLVMSGRKSLNNWRRCKIVISTHPQVDRQFNFGDRLIFLLRSLKPWGHQKLSRSKLRPIWQSLPNSRSIHPVRKDAFDDYRNSKKDITFSCFYQMIQKLLCWSRYSPLIEELAWTIWSLTWLHMIQNQY